MGKARERELRLTGVWMATIAVLVAVVAIWAAVSVGAKFRSQAPSVSGTHTSISR